MDVRELAYWINERESIRQKRLARAPKPWSADPIFQQYRFCNVRREDDTVTQWIRDNWRLPYADHPNLWFAMCLSRQINWPETLEAIGFPTVWAPEKVRDIMLSRGGEGKKVWGGAYMLRGNIQKGGDKPRYMVDNMSFLFAMQAKPQHNETLQGYHERLIQYPGWGSFLAAQAVADLKHTKWLGSATDWWDWAALGPGSTKGLNIIFGRPVKKGIPQKQGLAEMIAVREAVSPLLHDYVQQPLSLQDLQNCLCESFKYNRGHGKQKYPGL